MVKIDVLSILIMIVVTAVVVAVLLVRKEGHQNVKLYGEIDINTTTSSVKPQAAPPPV